LKRLLEGGAQVNSQDGSFERTPLLYAATTGSEETVRLLLDRGAEINAPDWAGHTPLWWARRRGKTPIVKLLEQAGGTDSSPLTKSDKPLLLKSPAEACSVQRAVNLALPLLQNSGVQFTQRKQCVSCHHQSAVALTVSLARARGFNVNQEIAAKEHAHVLAHLGENRERLLCGNGIDPLLAAWALWGLGAEKQEPNSLTDALVHYLVLAQKKDGQWQNRVYRPPHDASSFTFTALAVRGLQLYAPQGRSQEIARRIDRARAWLVAANPVDTEDKASQLLGLRWAGAEPNPIRQAVSLLMGEQRPDGGWAQLPTLPSDAYATGEVLFALHEGDGVPVSDAAYQRGVAFLLRTQLADGSWYVPSRSFPIIEAFASGFPHGRSQFISVAATCWAAMALTLTVPSKDGPY
jgi:hypothetical protein